MDSGGFVVAQKARLRWYTHLIREDKGERVKGIME
jgi:hypothetical protein